MYRKYRTGDLPGEWPPSPYPSLRTPTCLQLPFSIAPLPLSPRTLRSPLFTSADRHFIDIQIRTREIIMPLQALARRDPTVARNLFSSIFNSLYKQVPKNSADQMKPELRMQFENVFKTTRHNTPFIGCLLKVSRLHLVNISFFSPSSPPFFFFFFFEYLRYVWNTSLWPLQRVLWVRQL